MNPFKGKCVDCKFYTGHYCRLLDTEVEPWWTGCCRYKSPDDLQNHETE